MSLNVELTTSSLVTSWLLHHSCACHINIIRNKLYVP